MAEGPEVPKRRGRPPLPRGKGKRYNLGIRTTKELRDLLRKAAALSGRSVAQEIEFRLERSFERDESVKDAMTATFGDERLLSLFTTFADYGRSYSLAEQDVKRWLDAHYKWLDDQEVATKTFNHWKEILDIFLKKENWSAIGNERAPGAVIFRTPLVRTRRRK
jgi:hypothetical protein